MILQWYSWNIIIQVTIFLYRTDTNKFSKLVFGANIRKSHLLNENVQLKTRNPNSHRLILDKMLKKDYGILHNHFCPM